MAVSYVLNCTGRVAGSVNDMDLDVTVYKSEDDYIVLSVRGLAQGSVLFPDWNTLMAFFIDCQVLLGSFEGGVATNDSTIPDAILEAFEEDRP